LIATDSINRTKDKAHYDEVAVQFVTQSAAIRTRYAILEDYRLSSAGRRFADAANFVRAYARDLPRPKALLPPSTHNPWRAS